MDGVVGTVVKGAIGLVVVNGSGGIPQYTLPGFSNFKGGVNLGFVLRNAFDLLGIEDGVNAMDLLVGLRSRRGLIGRGVAPRCIGARIRSGEIPKLDLRPLLSFANLPAVFGGLPIRHPPRIGVAVLHSYRKQVQGVAAGKIRGEPFGEL